MDSRELISDICIGSGAVLVSQHHTWWASLILIVVLVFVANFVAEAIVDLVEWWKK